MDRISLVVDLCYCYPAESNELHESLMKKRDTDAEDDEGEV